MLSYKSNKQAVVIAIAIILLCLVCLTGSTYALFTSSTEDGTIGVVTTTGFIKVDIVSETDPEDSLVGRSLKFEGGEILFEPGAMIFTEGFKVKNDGTIPINFRLYVSDDEDMDMTKFNEAFEIWISTNPNDPSVPSVKPIDFVGSLEPGKCSTDTYYLYIKMKESAGNEFQDHEFSGIGVTVYAVQSNNAEIKE